VSGMLVLAVVYHQSIHLATLELLCIGYTPQDYSTRSAWTVQWNCGERRELSGMIRWTTITVAKCCKERSEGMLPINVAYY
jgi:hypothetical protein